MASVEMLETVSQVASDPSHQFTWIVSALIGGSIGLGIIFLAVPFSNVIIRMRASYIPTGGVALVGGDAMESIGQERTRSFFKIISRIKHIEGWSGFFKGFMPTIFGGLVIGVLTTAVAFVMALIYRAIPFLPSGPPEHPFGLKFLPIIYTDAVFALLLSLPLTVLINRATVTPFRLPWFGLKDGWNAIFNAKERKNIFQLYLLPGLLAVQVLELVLGMLTMTLMAHFLFPLIEPWRQPNGHIGTIIVNWIKFSIYVAIVIVETLVFTPLDVITVRLSLQTRQPPIALSENPEILTDGSEEDSYSGDRVINVRPMEYPYTGFLDCADKIMKEEGIGALYTAWWVNFVALLCGAAAGGPGSGVGGRNIFT